jgi:hypothetical protein
MSTTAGSRLQNPRTGAFWGQMPETEHAVQVYRDDKTLLDSLESFVASGLRCGESVILIATASHLHEVEKRLRGGWVDLDRARWEDRYIAVLAQETLGRFMVDGLPDEALFEKAAKGLIERARGRGRKLRAFGEMVGVLWAEGQKDAALRLEHLWTRLQSREKFPLFCGYARAQLRAGSIESDIQSICAAHTRIVPGYV